MPDAPPANDQLPWGHRGGTGICLSGGGIRAAAFGLGALQGLQQERELLVGAQCAHYLSAVSGGSYSAAAFTLNAKHLDGATADPAPLHPDSAESRYIVANGDYLKRWGRSGLGARGWWMTAAVFALFGAVNFAGFVSLFAVVGGLLVGVGEVLDGTLGHYSALEGVALGVLAAVGIWAILHNLYRHPRRWLVLMAGLALVLVGSTALVDLALDAAPWARQQVGAMDWWLIALVVGAYGALSFVTFKSRWLTRIAGSLSTTPPRLLGMYLVALAIEIESGWGMHPALLIVLALAVGALTTIVLARISLHRLYRDRISHCFAVRRDPASEDGVEHVGPDHPMSGLGPPAWPERCQASFPRLMICATANVRRRIGLRWETYEPFTFSHDYCWPPRKAECRYETAVLEGGLRPAWLGTEPVLSLMTAVATAGAAVSPAMGAKTKRGLRSLIALLNFRLGAWFPNPLNPTITLEGRWWWRREHWWQKPEHVALGQGYDEFLPELLGLDSVAAPRVYVSDGGHYDNLGLIMLLRARCSEIWCVDSQADAKGAAGQLRDVVEIARHYGYVQSITWPLGLDVFKRVGEWQGASHAIGEITYHGGATAKLVVVKLALTVDSCDELRAYCLQDGCGPLRRWLQFPHDATFTRPAFSPERMEHYRRLGLENAKRASEALADQPAPAPAP